MRRECSHSWIFADFFFLHITPYAGPAERNGSLFLARRRVTERYHMVSWQKYKVPLAVWSSVLNLNAKSDNWVRQEKKLSSKVLFISFRHCFTFHLFFLSCPVLLLFLSLSLFSFFLDPCRKQTALGAQWIRKDGLYLENPLEGLPCHSFIGSLL